MRVMINIPLFGEKDILNSFIQIGTAYINAVVCKARYYVVGCNLNYEIFEQFKDKVRDVDCLLVVETVLDYRKLIYMPEKLIQRY